MAISSVVGSNEWNWSRLTKYGTSETNAEVTEHPAGLFNAPVSVNVLFSQLELHGLSYSMYMLKFYLAKSDYFLTKS